MITLNAKKAWETHAISYWMAKVEERVTIHIYIYIYL